MKILTFDMEDWFHLLDHPDTDNEKKWNTFPSRFENNANRILDLVISKNVKATFFCLGWIAEKFPNIIKEIVNGGFEVGCHSNHHQLAFNQTADQFKEDLRTAKNILEDVTGSEINTYRAPGFSITQQNLWAFDILVDTGIKVDCSVFPALRAHGGMPSFKQSKPCKIITPSKHELYELPLNTHKVFGFDLVFSGGGYFRLFPYYLLKKLFLENNYVMTYFHPRDFDPQQPVIPNLSLIRRFKSYYGLKNAEFKLKKLIDEVSFLDVRTSVSEIDWSNVLEVKL